MLWKISITAILLILAFPNPQISILAWIAFIPLFSAIDISSRRQAFFLSYLAGIIFFAGLIYWLTYVTKLGYFILVAALAIFFALFGLLTNVFLTRLRTSKLRFLSFLLIPALWVSLEFIRSILFTGFPWGILGYTQYNNPVIIQIADITGAYGVSFIVVMVNFVIYAYLTKYLRKIPDRTLSMQLVASAVIIAAVILYGYYELGRKDIETGLKLSVVQGNIEQEKKWDPAYREFILERYESLSEKAAKDGSDLMIWPETAIPGYFGEKGIDTRLKKIIKDTGTSLFIGAVTYEVEFVDGEDHFYNSAVLIPSTGNIIKRYDKLHLVPFGEYIPFERQLPFFRDFIDVPVGDYTPGEGYAMFDIAAGSADLKYAALICFEDIFPSFVRRFVRGGADFLINITNDAWFKESSEQLQHAQASVFRAIENRVAVVRAANTGFSCYISPKGIIEASIRDPQTGSMYIPAHKTFDLKISRKTSLYTKFGNLFTSLCLLLLLGTVLTVNLGRFWKYT
jgi:apolipoprotein N-acyltransferase